MTAVKSIIVAACAVVALAGCKSATLNQAFVVGETAYSSASVVRVERFRGRTGWEGVHPGRCGGVLIADNIALTAAHCVSGYKYYSDADLIDVVLADGTRSGVAAMVVSPAFNQLPGKAENADVADDWAVLRLKKPLGAGRAVAPVYFDGNFLRPAFAGPFMQAGFTKDARIKNIYNQCAVVAHWKRAIESDCSISFGDSGGPMFSLIEGNMRVVGVASGKSRNNTGYYTMLTHVTREAVKSLAAD